MLNIVRTQPATLADAALTSAQIPFIPMGGNAPQVLAQHAQSLGMTPVPGMTDAWEAPDGSWAMLNPSGRLDRGFKVQGDAVSLQGIPSVVLANTPVVDFRALGQPTLALGQLGGMDTASPQSWPGLLANEGFVQSGSAANRYTHPDGSWAMLIRDPVAGPSVEVGVGAQRVNLSTLPASASASTATAPAAGAVSAPVMADKITLGSANAIRPMGQPQYGALTVASPTLPRINADPQSLKAAVDATGVPYTVVGQDQYQFADGSWALYNPSGFNGSPAIERGYEAPDGRMFHFYGLPQDFTQLPLAPASSLADSLAAATVPTSHGGNVAAFEQDLISARGFTKDATGLPYFTHADGSWAAVSGNNVHVGHQGSRVDANSFFTLPPVLPGGAQIPTSPNPGAFPSNQSWVNWKSQGYRVAWLPYAASGTFTMPELRRVLEYMGWQEQSPGKWMHGDSSSVDVNSDGSVNPLTISFCGQDFSRFPYDSGYFGWLTTEATAWQNWLRGAGLAPTDDPNWKRSCGV